MVRWYLPLSRKDFSLAWSTLIRVATTYPVIEITVGHRSRPTRFPIWPSNLFLKFVEMADHWMRLSGLRRVRNYVFDMVRKWKEKGLFIEHYLCPPQNFMKPKLICKSQICMGKLLMKVNIVQTQLWEKPIYKLLSCFWKQHVLSRLLIRFYLFIYLVIYLFLFFFVGEGGKGTNQASQNNSFRPLLNSM